MPSSPLLLQVRVPGAIAATGDDAAAAAAAAPPAADAVATAAASVEVPGAIAATGDDTKSVLLVLWVDAALSPTHQSVRPDADSKVGTGAGGYATG